MKRCLTANTPQAITQNAKLHVATINRTKSSNTQSLQLGRGYSTTEKSHLRWFSHAAHEPRPEHGPGPRLAQLPAQYFSIFRHGNSIGRRPCPTVKFQAQHTHKARLRQPTQIRRQCRAGTRRRGSSQIFNCSRQRFAACTAVDTWAGAGASSLP